MEVEVRALLSRMEEDGLVEAEGNSQICLSILGHACGQSPLRLKSSLRLIEMLRQMSPEALTAHSLMALIQALPELDERYTPMGRGARAESGRASEMSARYGGLISGMLQRYAVSDVRYYARCKRSLILADWISGIPMDEIEAKYTSNPFAPVGHGDIRGLADATRFYLSSALRILVIMHAGTGPSDEEIEAFLQRLDLGLPEDVLELTEIPLVLQRGEYLALRNANLKTSKQVRELEHERLVALLGEARAEEIRTHNKPT